MTKALNISRRDFLNGVAIGTGAALLRTVAPAAAYERATPALDSDWYGYGGIGDYSASHGNTPDVVACAHEIRDGRYVRLPKEVTDTGELFDAIVVGGGMAGLGAAFEFQQRTNANQTCLVLENHPIWGGESKRNEFLVDGHLLIAPQGANGFSVPKPTLGSFASDDGRYFDAIGIPRTFQYAQWDEKHKRLRFANDNYGYLYWTERSVDVAYFRGVGGGSKPVINPWSQNLAGTKWSAVERAELRAWRGQSRRYYDGSDFEQWLDSMTYQQFVERVMGLGRHVTNYASPLLAAAVGLGSDVVSAYAAYAILLPGTINFYPAESRDLSTYERHSFPGGNDGFARHFVKKLIPEAISGDASFESVMNSRIQWDQLDVASRPIRMRLGSTVVAVEHDGDPHTAHQVSVIYNRAGMLYRVRGRRVVMASGGWINQYIVRDLPEGHRAAYATFKHAPFLVANVAVHNWRFIYDLGATSCRYVGDFGFCVNVRRPMEVGDYRPALDPDSPTVLSFYVPFCDAGQPALAQCIRGRMELLQTPYANYESRIVAQLRDLFGSAFSERRDLAGIILNRWGHAYLVPEPGFYFGRNGQPAPRDVVRKPYGRISFGHSELRGNQHWGSAVAEGARAMAQVLEVT